MSRVTRLAVHIFALWVDEHGDQIGRIFALKAILKPRSIMCLKITLDDQMFGIRIDIKDMD
jgi:hypothetical protein